MYYPIITKSTIILLKINIFKIINFPLSFSNRTRRLDFSYNPFNTFKIKGGSFKSCQINWQLLCMNSYFLFLLSSNWWYTLFQGFLTSAAFANPRLFGNTEKRQKKGKRKRKREGGWQGASIMLVVLNYIIRNGAYYFRSFQTVTANLKRWRRSAPPSSWTLVRRYRWKWRHIWWAVFSVKLINFHFLYVHKKSYK